MVFRTLTWQAEGRILYTRIIMKKIGLLFCVIVFFLISCAGQQEQTQPKPQQPQSQQQQPQPAEPKANTETPPPKTQEVVFDPATISQQEKDTAKIEIQQLIQRLNGIIRAKNYNAWVSYLDSGYFTMISSSEHLEQVSKSPVLVKQKIVLKSAQDYFNHVVVPSRTNDRVDDIEFVSQNRVKAYTVNNAGNRLRLYDLEKFGSEWKIIN